VTDETVDAVQGGVSRAVPRILTPAQLADFLRDAVPEELELLCRSNGWSL
jgi:hypothetical protein